MYKKQLLSASHNTVDIKGNVPGVKIPTSRILSLSLVSAIIMLMK